MKRRLLLMPLRERLYMALKNDILLNRYEPGAELRIEKLAQKYGVSTTPVREALVRLEGDGLNVGGPKPETVRCVIEEQLEILAAALKQNEEKTAAAIRRHLIKAEARALKSLEDKLTA
ncbi:MAG: GntR family transcriptional regulator [Firmicutes bacterium]|nr:GntR family transcriptional regulator [Bacillota bacterium]